MRIQVAFLIDTDVPDSMRDFLEKSVEAAIQRALATHSGELFFGSFEMIEGMPPRDITWGTQISFKKEKA